MSYGYGGYGGFQPYVPVHVRRAKAASALPKRLGKGKTPSPVTGTGHKIASSFWGQAWCRNLERYGDYSNRIPRGRTYIRNGSVVHLDVLPGRAVAYVSGSTLYTVNVKIKPVAAARWKALCAACVGSIASLVELLRGDLDEGVMERVCGEEAGLFPKPNEIEFDCSCPDYAGMCKHVAAVLYGIGVRFDDDPEILFRLRQVSASELVAGAAKGLVVAKRAPQAGKVLAREDVASVFGVELADVGAPPPPAVPAPTKRARSKALRTDATTPAKATGPSHSPAKAPSARGVKGPRPKASPSAANEVTVAPPAAPPRRGLRRR